MRFESREGKGQWVPELLPGKMSAWRGARRPKTHQRGCQRHSRLSQEGTSDVHRHDLQWDGHRLRLRSGRLLATIVPDREWDGMWRVSRPDGCVTDMLNLTRAKDAAQLLALASLNASAPGRAA
jgi:hypothetical protein